MTKSYRIVLIALFAIAAIYFISCGKKDPVSPEPTGPGGKIVYVRYSPDIRHGIYIMNSDGSNRAKIVDSTGDETSAHCSWGGDKIAFSWNISGVPHIYTANMDGTDIQQLTAGSDHHYWPRWSPGDSLIAFQRYENSLGNWNIWVKHPGTGNEVRITTDQATDLFPSWSPDGSKLLFYSNRDGDDDIYVIDIGMGLPPEPLTVNNIDDIDPRFSHDGQWIAFVSQDRGVAESDLEVFKMRSDGTEITQLTKNAFDDYGPTWSPDDNWIAYHSIQYGNYEIYRMRADGTDNVNLSNDPGEDQMPDWTK